MHRYQAQALDRPLLEQGARQALEADKARRFRCYLNHKGPRPVRSYKSPKGLDTLTAAERRRCILGNLFADFTREVLTLASATKLSFVLLEQPEDLGAMAYGPHAGERPASMWQWPAFALSLIGKLLCFIKATWGPATPSQRAC